MSASPVPVVGLIRAPSIAGKTGPKYNTLAHLPDAGKKVKQGVETRGRDYLTFKKRVKEDLSQGGAIEARP